MDAKSSRVVKPRIHLDLGCGENKQHGYIGIDKREIAGVDIVHDLEAFPWPLEDNSVTLIKCSHVIEHIKPQFQIDFMNECWRVLGHDDVLLISTPHGDSPRYTQDPTHCTPWNQYTAAYFELGQPLYDIYKPKPWKIERIYWHPYGDIEVAYRSIKNENIDNKHT